VADKLAEAAKAAVGWTGSSGIAFEKEKAEAALFRRRGSVPSASTKVGDKEVPFNPEAARWLGVR